MKALLIINLINILILNYLTIGVIYAKKRTDDIDTFIYCVLAWAYVSIATKRMVKRVEKNYNNSQIKKMIDLDTYSDIVGNALSVSNVRVTKKSIDEVCANIDREYRNQLAQLN